MSLTKKQVKNVVICTILAVLFFAVFFGTQGMTETPSGMPDGIDMRGAYLTITILFIAFVLFFTEVFPLAITSMLVPIALSFPGVDILPGKSAFENFGDDWVVTFMAIFMVGEAIFRTGLATKIGNAVLKVAGKSQRSIILVMGATVGIISAFLSNSATMALFAPIIISVAKSSNLKASQVLMPMAFLICTGGNMTLLGASSKGVINGLMENAGVTPFGFFEYTPIGLVLFGIALIYFAVIGYKLLPSIDVIDQDLAKEGKKEEKVTERPEKMIFALIGFAVVIITMAADILEAPVAAMVGMVIVVVSGCITMSEAYKAVNWTTIFLFAGMLALGGALVDTGADKLIAFYVNQIFTTPTSMLAAIFIMTMLLTNFMSNTASASVAAPIAISSAQLFGVSALPFCMAVGIGASLCYMTPIATPANTIAFGLGGYSFKDFAKVGLPLQIIMAIAGIIFIPMFFPF